MFVGKGQEALSRLSGYSRDYDNDHPEDEPSSFFAKVGKL